jgi:hypothetical protein
MPVTPGLVLEALVLILMVFGATFWFLAPTLSRRGAFFAVDLKFGDRIAPRAARELRSYRRAVAFHTVVALTLVIFSVHLHLGSGVGFAVLWQILGPAIGFIRARNAMRPFAPAFPAVREASLALRPRAVLDRPLTQALPFIPLLATTLTIAIWWQRVPSLSRGNWRGTGLVALWAQRMPPTILLAIIAGFVSCGGLAATGWIARNWSRRIYWNGSGTMAERLIPSRVGGVLLILECLTATIFSVLGSMPLLESKVPASLAVIVPWAALTVSVAVLGWCLFRLRGDYRPSFSRPIGWLLTGCVIAVPGVLAFGLITRRS